MFNLEPIYLLCHIIYGMTKINHIYKVNNNMLAYNKPCHL
jgi:hypothetical protein